MKKYNVNTELIDSMLRDDEDLNSFRERTFRQMHCSDDKRVPILPGQARANVSELEKELKGTKDLPLQVSLLSTIISKCSDTERPGYYEKKIRCLIRLKRLEEAQQDIDSLLQLNDTPKTRVLKARVLINMREAPAAMIEFLRANEAPGDPELNELFVHILSSLFRLEIPQYFFTAGSNLNFALGDNTSNPSYKPKSLIELKGRIPLQSSCGNFHSLLLVSSCLHAPLCTYCENGVFTCNGGTDVLVWGDNSSGQLLGYKTAEAVQRPQCMQRTVGKQPKYVSTGRCLSAVVLSTDEVLIQGELPGIEETYIVLPESAEQVAVGGRFVIISNSIEVKLWGEMEHHGLYSVASSGLYNTKVLLSVAVTEISAGQGHALILGDGAVYSIGCGDVGQLGLGPDILALESPEIVELPGSSIHIYCTSVMSLAVTDSHVYIWGLVNPDGLERMPAIEWYPRILEGVETGLRELGVSDRQVLAIDKQGTFYMWEVNYSRRLRRPPDEYRALADIRAVSMGKSMNQFLLGVLIPRLTQVLDCPAQASAETPFYIELQFYDQFGAVAPRNPQIQVVFTTQHDPNEKITLKTKSSLEFSFEIVESREFTTCEMTPLACGDFYMNILVRGEVVPESPKFIRILPNSSQEETRKAEEEKNEREQAKKLHEEELRKRAGEELQRSREMQREQEQKKKAETDRRAQEALKALRARQNREQEEKERNRKMKLELKTGGGFDLSKLKKSSERL